MYKRDSIVVEYAAGRVVCHSVYCLFLLFKNKIKKVSALANISGPSHNKMFCPNFIFMGKVLQYFFLHFDLSEEYVTCHTCRSPDTMLHKETRLFFLQCETCGSRCSVASIKSGFQAITGKRAALKNKQQ